MSWMQTAKHKISDNQEYQGSPFFSLCSFKAEPYHSSSEINLAAFEMAVSLEASGVPSSEKALCTTGIVNIKPGVTIPNSPKK